MARPRKPLPPAAIVREMRKKGIAWKVIEEITGVSRQTILRRVLDNGPRVLDKTNISATGIRVANRGYAI